MLSFYVVMLNVPSTNVLCCKKGPQMKSFQVNNSLSIYNKIQSIEKLLFCGYFFSFLFNKDCFGSFFLYLASLITRSCAYLYSCILTSDIWYYAGFLGTNNLFIANFVHQSPFMILTHTKVIYTQHNPFTMLPLRFFMLRNQNLSILF